MSAQRFKPYPAYKDSGVEWLGEIPAHWEAMREISQVDPILHRRMSDLDSEFVSYDDGIRSAASAPLNADKTRQ